MRRLPFLLVVLTVSGAAGATTLPALWTAGGLSAGIDSAGQAARIATDPSGNVAVVSGPSGGRDLAVTSYTADGILRWRRTVTPAVGTFVGDWVVAAPNADFVGDRAQPRLSRGVRSPAPCSGTTRTGRSCGEWTSLRHFFPAAARLVVDAAGNAYARLECGRERPHSGAEVQPDRRAWSGRKWISTGGGLRRRLLAGVEPRRDRRGGDGGVSGGATWITAVYDAATGARRWQVTAAEGTRRQGRRGGRHAGVRDRPGRDRRGHSRARRTF